MENLSKFELISSVMDRLGVTPSALTLVMLQDKSLKVCFETQNVAEKKIVGRSSSVQLVTKNVVETEKKPANKKQGSLKPTSAETKADHFYEQNWTMLQDVFVLNKKSLSQVRCGMFAYMHGSKMEICKNLLPSKKVRNQNYIFKGVVFDKSDTCISILNFVAFAKDYSCASKKLLSENRLPLVEECEKIFVYQDILHSAFQKMSLNLKKVEKLFCSDDNCSASNAALFNMQEGKSFSENKKVAVADVYQVTVYNLD